MKEFYKNKRVLVTGASGFIGKHLAHTLKSLGAIVGVTEHKNIVMGGYDKYYKCNLQNYSEVHKTIYDFSPDIVFHLASQAIVTDAEISDLDTFQTNVMGSVNLYHCLATNLELKLHGVITASTDKVYGRNSNLPYHETYPLLGTHQIYEASKTCEDVVSQAYSYSYGLPIAITRFGNVYGPGDNHLSRIIPGTIASYIKKETPKIRSNGQHYRDFIYIDDVIDGYLQLGKFRCTNYNTDLMIYNFGTGIPSRVLDVVGMIAENFSNSSVATINYGAEDEIKQQYVDSTQAYNDFGWKAKIPLRVGIPVTVDWYKENYVIRN